MAKMVLWSPMKGRVVLNGEPAAGAVLVRTYEWHWKDEKASDRTTANANGEFSFPAIVGRSLLGGIVPHEPVVDQAMTIEYKGKTYRAWNHFKHNYDENTENPNRGQPINVTCRLDAERSAHGDVAGICDFN